MSLIITPSRKKKIKKSLLHNKTLQNCVGWYTFTVTPIQKYFLKKIIWEN